MKVGDTFRNGKRKCHIRGFVDGLVVFRWWKASKQYWDYGVIEAEFVTLDK